jgi:hypothetical protein
MAADYRQFMTPYFEVTVGDPSWKRKVQLPHHILRLIEKIEITEAFYTPDAPEQPVMTITFIEGSREPASPDHKMGTSGLYQVPMSGDKVDMSIAGSLTNRPGIITDLRFSGSGGITFLTDKEKKTGKVDNKVQKNVQGDNTTRDYPNEPRTPRFLFQEFNKIQVKWGYVEDQKNQRTCMLNIIQMSTEFPEKGMPRTTVTCGPTHMLLDQFSTKNGVTFGTRKTDSKDGHSLLTVTDNKVDDIVKTIAQKSGMGVIISKELPADTVDKDKQRMWISGESFDQFMKRLADSCGCYYSIIPHASTGVDTIMFIKKTDFERHTVLSDKELLNWKGPGSIIKDIRINADFSGLVGNAQKGINNKGEKQSDKDVDVRLLAQHKSSTTGKTQEIINASPLGNNPNPAAVGIAKGIANNEVVGMCEYSPNESKEIMQDKSAVRGEEHLRLIQLDFTTIGYPKLTPGVTEITGIGVRYSGKYRLIKVTHTIDQNGYVTKCSGVSSTLGSGGVTPPPISPKGDDKLVDVGLFKAMNSARGK